MSLRKFEKLFCGVAAVAVGWWGCGCGATKRAVAKHGALAAATALEVAAARLEATERRLPAAAAAAQRLGLGEGGQRRAAHSKRMQVAAAGGEGAALLPSGAGGLAQKLAAAAGGDATTPTGGTFEELAAKHNWPIFNEGAFKWPKTGDHYEVPFEFPIQQSEEEKNSREWVLAQMQHFTNFHFVTHKDETQYIKIYWTNVGCSAVQGYPIELHLDASCTTRRAMLRVLVNALGFKFDDRNRGVLTACDIAAIYKEYPGPIDPPLCNETVGIHHPSMCEPLPGCPYEEETCIDKCSNDCDAHIPPSKAEAVCKLRPFSEIEAQYTYKEKTPSENRAVVEETEEGGNDEEASGAAGRRPLWWAAGLWSICLAAGGLVR